VPPLVPKAAALLYGDDSAQNADLRNAYGLGTDADVFGNDLLIGGDGVDRQVDCGRCLCWFRCVVVLTCFCCCCCM
jgi:hypothetical protein